MNRLTREGVSRTARYRLIRYLNCNQATLGTIADFLGEGDGHLLKVNCQLEGGGFSSGSTCGVVSGGCLAIGLRYLDDIRSEEPGKMAALHSLLKEYTSWFEKEFKSTLCRERSGVEVNSFWGFMNYIFLGKVFTRCVNHVGKAADWLAEKVSNPLNEEDPGGVTQVNHCAVDVLRELRRETGLGSELIEDLYVTLNGGIGLSGGLCAAVAGAFVPIGWRFGIDPKGEGAWGTLTLFLKGHINLYRGREEGELWSVGQEFLRNYFKKFKALECEKLTNKKFTGFQDFARFAEEAEVCREIKDWSLNETLRLMEKY